MANETWRRLKPLLPGQLYLRADPLLDRYLTSMNGAGRLSLFYIGHQVYSSISQVFYKAVASPMAPRLAIDANEEDWESYRRAYRQRVWAVLALTIAGCLLLFIIGLPVLNLAIGHGGVTSENVRILWLIMLSLAGFLCGGSALQITSVAFYALGDTKTPTLLSTIIFTIYIPFKVLIFMRYSLVWMAVSMSIYFVVSFLIQFIVLEKAIGRRIHHGRQGLSEKQRLEVHLRSSKGLT